MPPELRQAHGARLPPLLACGFLAVLALKVFLAARLDLYSDEVFYWLASTFPAPAYSDLPFMTAWLAGLGAGLAPGESLAARAPFLALGAAVPALVYWLALPLAGPRQALEAAGLSLCLPLAGFLGLLAVPDVPLVFFGLAAAGFLDRALRRGGTGFWLAAGVAVGLGLCTHYRFALYPFAFALFLLLHRPARRRWREPGPWLATAAAALGLAPALWFNLSHDLSGAAFHLVERHPWEFRAAGLLHPFKQAGAASPPLYGVLGIAAWLMVRRAREGDQAAAMLLTLAGANLSVYLLLAPWTDADSTSIHWPLSGYFPLLAYAPAALRRLHAWLRPRGERRARLLIACVPAAGFAGTLIALAGVGSQAFLPQLLPLAGPGTLSNKMAGWEAFSRHTERLLAERFPERAPLVATANYYTAAQLRFAGAAPEAVTMDRDKAARDGRLLQLALWGMDDAALAGAAGGAALYVSEDSAMTLGRRDELLAFLCRRSGRVERIDALSLYGGEKRFSFYRADGLKDAAAGPAAFPCPYPARAWVDRPAPGETLEGEVEVGGWAYNEDVGVARVRVLVDGVPAGAAEYGLSRPDVVEVMGVGSDPNAPHLGFRMALDTAGLPDGRHRLELEVVDRRGTAVRRGAREVVTRNRRAADR